MRTFFYAFAAICGILAFVTFLYPIVTSLDNLRSGLGALIMLGIVTSIVPLTVALAVIPLCIAVAFDLATREHQP